MVIKVKLKPETIYDFEIDDISADIDNRRFEDSQKRADSLPEPLRTEQLKRIREGRASQRFA